MSSSKGFWYDLGCTKYVSLTARNVIPSFGQMVDHLPPGSDESARQKTKQPPESITAASEQFRLQLSFRGIGKICGQGTVWTVAKYFCYRAKGKKKLVKTESINCSVLIPF